MGEICIGVQKDEQNQPFGPGNFSAHAWVEYDGMALNDRPDVREHYVVFEHLSLQN